MGSSAPEVPQYNAPKMPKFKPADVGALNQQSIGYDREGYDLSDADFAARFPELLAAQDLFRQRTLDDFNKSSVPSQALHDEMMRAGISNAIGAFGGNIAPNSAAEASVARNLGLGVLDLQDRNRRNQNEGITMATQMFQPRTFGFGGQGALQLELANLEGQNAWNQANYAAQVSGGQFNSGINAQNQNAKTQASNNNTAAIGAAASAAAVGAVACWMAREAFGAADIRWKQFRKWLLSESPLWFFRRYLRHGRSGAAVIRSAPLLKPFVRQAMMLAIS